jgi:hypothetical protein
MATDLHTGSEQSVSGLVSRLINDGQELLKQQLTLFKHEVEDDFRKTRAASAALVGGALVALVGGVLLSLSLVHLLNWALPTWPLWTCYLTVGGVIALIGAGLTGAAWHQFQTFNPLPDKTAQAIKENLEWKTKPS